MNCQCSSHGQAQAQGQGIVYQCCYYYRSYDFYHNISELSYHIFITIFPVRAERYICEALALCKHDRFTTSLRKFQHASITCCERRDTYDYRPANVAEQRLRERRRNCLWSNVSQVVSMAWAVFMTWQLTITSMSALWLWAVTMTENLTNCSVHW